MQTAETVEGETEFIDITPNYDHLFETFLHDLGYYAEQMLKPLKDKMIREEAVMDEVDPDHRVEEARLGAIHGVISAISVSLSSATSQEQIDRLRRAVGELQSKLNDRRIEINWGDTSTSPDEDEEE